MSFLFKELNLYALELVCMCVCVLVCTLFGKHSSVAVGS